MNATATLAEQSPDTLAHLVTVARLLVDVERDTAARAASTATPLVRALLAHRVEVAEAELADREAALRARVGGLEAWFGAVFVGGPGLPNAGAIAGERDALRAAALEAYTALEVGGPDCVARARRALRGVLAAQATDPRCGPEIERRNGL